MKSVNKKMVWLCVVFSTFFSVSAFGQQFYFTPGSSATAGDLFRIDAQTCVITTIGPVGFSVTGLAIDNEGNLYGTESTNFASPDGAGKLLRINQSTGAGVSMGLMTGANGDNPSVPDITFSGTTLYAWTESGDDLMTLDPATGAELTYIPSPRSSFGTGLAAHSNGDLYLMPQGNDVYRLDPGSGDVTLINTITDLDTVGFPNGLSFDAQDNLWANAKPSGSGNSGNLVSIDILGGTYDLVCAGLPLEIDSLVYYGASDLIYKDGFGLLPFIAR
ncbi:MAG: DUF6923 family protein [Marinicella sp.]